ncbi:MAG: hypothetical protein ACO1Q7_20660 [Gemmatimonas sp.]
MRQSRLYRLLGSLLVPLYAMGAWAAPALKVCPMHGSPAAGHATASVTEGTPAAHDGHSAHVVNSEDSVAQVTSADVVIGNEHVASSGTGTEHTHGCDCIGCCAGSNGPALHGSQVAFVAPTFVESAGSVEIRNAEVAAARLAHVLPFATAPPNALV